MRYLIVLLLAGCASMNDSLTPSLTVLKDDFDGTMIARQPRVGAASSIGETMHTLALDWSQKTPDVVYVTAGLWGTQAITGLAFNADGKMIENIQQASATTSFDGSGYTRESSRRFAMSWADFLTVANAHSVKMRVSGVNAYTVSSFGPDHSGAIINTKLKPFAEKVGELRAAGKR